MGLRLKVIVMLVALVVPLLGVFTVYRFSMERRAHAALRAERAAGRIQDNPAMACRDPKAREAREARERRRPRRARRARRMPHLFAYDTSFAPIHEGQPPIPAAAIEEFTAQGGQDLVHSYIWRGPVLGVTLVPVDGPRSCRVIMIPWEERGRANRGAVHRLVVQQSLVMLVLLLLTGLMISIPLVRRVRKLTEEVARAPETQWTISPHLLKGEDEISTLARTLQKTGARVAETISELERRDAALKEYISNTTHDLAIPLTVLQHRLVRLRELLEAGDEVDASEVEVALEESHYIAALIANMSAAARLEAGEAHRLDHDVELTEIIERVVGRNRPIARQQKIAIEWAAPESVVIRGDSTLIEQAISNCVQNAVQYNEPGGNVAVLLEVSGDRFVLRVMDDGPGVSGERLETLTQRAARDDARNRNPGGQGFGLAITTRVCEVHDFDLALANGEEGGLVVTIEGELPG